MPEDFQRLDWQPTRAPAGARYVGSSACAKCHAAQASTQPRTAMGHALELPQDCQILRSHPRLTSRIGSFNYTIEHEGEGVIYRVTDGKQTISEPILAAFGLGDAGQTYVFLHQGSYYESQISFFNDVQNLDFTLGHPRKVPESLEEALGKPLTSDEVALCFACHSTSSVAGATLQLDRMTPGITCEGCHGPGGRHVAAIGAGNLTTPSIFNPGKLATGDLVDFCGSCHRGSSQVESMGMSGIQTVRFQPYRLSSSRCFSLQDPRISCLACHDPHQNRNRDSAFYDSKCLACHSGRARAARASETATSSVCPVGKKLCVSCHMPKYGLPGGHLKFTDHLIRVISPKINRN